MNVWPKARSQTSLAGIAFGAKGVQTESVLASFKPTTILYYTILYYTILYYTILYYTILYYTRLDYTISYYNILIL